MRGWVIIFMTTQTLVLSSWANARPYVGGSIGYYLMMGKSCPVESGATARLADCVSVPDHRGIALRGEAGLRVREGMIYGEIAAAHTGDSRESNYYFGNSDFYSKSESGWEELHVGVGCRVHVSENAPNPVKPMFGVGVLGGWVRRTHHYIDASPSSYVDVTESGTSPAHFGFFLEAGTLVGKFWTHHAAVLSLRIQSLAVKMHDSEQGFYADGVWGAMFQLGWIYSVAEH